MRPTPFDIAIPDRDLDALRLRLAGTRWAPEPGGGDWSFGVPRAWLRDLAEYWADGFDWRSQEAALNAYPQFRTELDGVPVHFVHVRGKGPDPVPLILTHG